MQIMINSLIHNFLIEFPTAYTFAKYYKVITIFGICSNVYVCVCVGARARTGSRLQCQVSSAALPE